MAVIWRLDQCNHPDSDCAVLFGNRGWVIKYLFEYVTGHAGTVAADGYFSSFISSGAATEICFLIFVFITLAIIFAGVRNWN